MFKALQEAGWAHGIYCPRCGSMMVKGHGNTSMALNDTSVRLVGEHSTIRLEPYSTILDLGNGLRSYCYSRTA